MMHTSPACRLNMVDLDLDLTDPWAWYPACRLSVVDLMTLGAQKRDRRREASERLPGQSYRQPRARGLLQVSGWMTSLHPSN